MATRRGLGFVALSRPPRLACDLEAFDETDDGLGGAEHQIAVTRGDARQAIEHVDLGLLVEINQHVTAEDDVELAELDEIAEQIELTVPDLRPDIGGDLP